MNEAPFVGQRQACLRQNRAQMLLRVPIQELAVAYHGLTMPVSAAVPKRPNVINNSRAGTVLSIRSTASTASEGEVVEESSQSQETVP